MSQLNLYKIRGLLKYRYKSINLFIIDSVLTFYTDDLTLIPYKDHLHLNDDISINNVFLSADESGLIIQFGHYPYKITFYKPFVIPRELREFNYVKKGLYTYRIPLSLRSMRCNVVYEKLFLFGDFLIKDIRFEITQRYLELAKDDMELYRDVIFYQHSSN